VILVHYRQVAETLPNHEIQCIGGAGVRLCAERVLGHNLLNSHIARLDASSYHSESQVFRREDTGNAIIVICNQHTILPLCCHQLCCFGHSCIGLDLEGRARLERKDCAGGRLLRKPYSSSGCLLLAQVGFDLPTDGLRTGKHGSSSNYASTPTSSLFDIFARLTLREVPASLCATWEA
jgi:hypothetical protein